MALTGTTTASQRNRMLLIALIAGLGLLFARRAWISDDAYITFRTVDNFINGYGLTWNAAERVQTYTHPLWMLLLSGAYALTREIFWTSTLISWILSISAAALLLAALAPRPRMAVLAAGLMAFSKAFVDYTSSGLENPLTFLLLALFAVIYLRPWRERTLFSLALIAALGLTTRLDTALLYLPALGYVFWRKPSRRAVRQILAGMLPLLAWELFSLFYYGFPFPNTAYAKLNTGIPRLELLEQGLYYFINLLEFDPLTLLVLLAALPLGLLAGQPRQRPLLLGIGLYLTYTLWIGGDFMGGRYFAAPYFLAVVLLVRCVALSDRAIWVGLAIAAVIGLQTPHHPLWFNDVALRQDSPVEYVDARGISDERLNYQLATGLLMAQRERELPDHVWAWQGVRDRHRERGVVVKFAVGFYGFFVGPHTYVLDQLALGDPLLARLPAARDTHWRIGHFIRTIPDGYERTLKDGENAIKDPDLARYYDSLKLITRGPLWSRARLVEIWRMNTGFYDGLIDRDAFRYPDQAQLRFSEALALTEPTELNASGLAITVGERTQVDLFAIWLSSADSFVIQFRQAGQVLDEIGLQAPIFPEQALALHAVSVPDAVRQSGFDQIWILPARGQGPYLFGGLASGE